MTNKALQYAEETLGVHKVFEEVGYLLTTLDDLLGDLDKAQDSRRLLDEAYTQREIELAGEMRGVHPNMTDTRFKSMWKEWEYGDAKLTELRHKLAEVRADIQGLEMDLEICRTKIKVGCARMDELGGYLNYLAAVKNQAEHEKKATTGEAE